VRPPDFAWWWLGAGLAVVLILLPFAIWGSP
jgi:hypothetical protein